MPIMLNEMSVKAGDVILIYSADKESRVNIFGQSVMRIRARHRSQPRVARYSHAMLGVDAGFVVHADGSVVKFDTLYDAVGSMEISEDQFRVLRLAEPPLDAATARRIADAGSYFLQQKYSFIPGRSTTPFGRFLHRKRALTHPFCSELVASAYARAGRPISDTPSDRILPIDLERLCVPPAWKDVTRTYIAARVPADPALEEVAADLYGHGKGLNLLTAKAIAVRNSAQDSIKAQIQLFEKLTVEAPVLEYRLALGFVGKKPHEILKGLLPCVDSDLKSISRFYEQLVLGPSRWPTPFTDVVAAHQALTPSVLPDGRAYEDLPAVDCMRQEEISGSVKQASAKAIRLVLELTALATLVENWQRGAEVAMDSTNQWQHYREVVLKALDYVPAISEGDANILMGNFGDRVEETDSEEVIDLYKLALKVILAHCACCAARPRSEESRAQK